MPKKQIIYMHKSSGNIKICRTELEGQLLGKEWTKMLFTKNAKGQNVMRVDFGKFVMEISPNGAREVVENGDGNPK